MKRASLLLLFTACLALTGTATDPAAEPTAEPIDADSEVDATVVTVTPPAATTPAPAAPAPPKLKAASKKVNLPVSLDQSTPYPTTPSICTQHDPNSFNPSFLLHYSTWNCFHPSNARTLT